jgi:1-acyl-sn-glycerol-3-phosphate acyltransferase
MVVLKALFLALAGLFSVLAMGFMLREMQAVKVKARARNDRPQRLRRLRQDPRTGVYYPEA